MKKFASDRGILVGLDADEEALGLFKSDEGSTFAAWNLKVRKILESYENAIIESGFPVDPEQAALKVPAWCSHLGYAEQQAAKARAYRKRANAVCRELLKARGHRATEAGADARTWRQDEAVERWEAVVRTLQEWIWEVRGKEKALSGPRGPGR